MAVLQQLLGKGYNVIVSDVDVVWLQDPFAGLASSKNDFSVTLDSNMKADGLQTPCTGVMHVRATEASRQVSSSAHTCCRTVLLCCYLRLGLSVCTQCRSPVKNWLSLARSESGGPSCFLGLGA